MLLFALLAVAMLPATQQMTSAAADSSEQNGEQPAVQPQQLNTPIQTNQTGRTAQSSAGQVGERQTRDTTAQAGIKPMARIENRIQNRVQNRLRSRIDRSYDPKSNTTNPFAVAEDQARTTGSLP